MTPAIASMLKKYSLESADDYTNALREIFQEIALCGLWRSKFFEHAAFYGGTALRVLHGLQRFSEHMDFSLKVPDARFDLTPHYKAIREELEAWGFSVEIQEKTKTKRSAIESAFVKANTRAQFLVIEAPETLVQTIHAERTLSIKVEVDTDPPPGFEIETQYLLAPIPFSVTVYALPYLFAGKMHALLCRQWKNRIKGRDWFDFVWYVQQECTLDLPHLESRMRQSGHYSDPDPLTDNRFRDMLNDKISTLDVSNARMDVENFVPNPSALSIWSQDFFRAVASKVRTRERRPG